jgi:hypothetical protein
MSAKYSAATMAEAASAIQLSQAYQAGKGEMLLNTLGMYLDIVSPVSVDSCPGDKFAALSDGQAVSSIQNFTTSAAFTVVKSQVTEFAENSQLLLKVLGEVGKIHPFIQSVSCSALTLSVITDPPYCSCGWCVLGGHCSRTCQTRE